MKTTETPADHRRHARIDDTLAAVHTGKVEVLEAAIAEAIDLAANGGTSDEVIDALERRLWRLTGVKR